MLKKFLISAAATTGVLPTLRHAQESFDPRRRAAVRHRVDFYRQFLPSAGGLVFDVGANMGNRAEAFLQLAAHVVAVEPQQQCVEVLTRRFGRNPAFSLIPAALGSKPGIGSISISSSHVLSSMAPEWTVQERFGESWLKEVDTRVTTLAALIDVFGTPHFCKIDVEGYEVNVLQGLSSPIPALSIEFTPELAHRTAECLEILAEIGNYRFAYSPGEEMSREPLQWAEAPRLLQRIKGAPFGDVYAQL